MLERIRLLINFNLFKICQLTNPRQLHPPEDPKQLKTTMVFTLPFANKYDIDSR